MLIFAAEVTALVFSFIYRGKVSQDASGVLNSPRILICV